MFHIKSRFCFWLTDKNQTVSHTRLYYEMLNESRSSPSNCLVSLYCIVELSITTRNFFFFLESMRLVNIFGRGRQFWHYGITFKFSFVLNNSTKNKSKYFLICTPKMYKIWNFFIDFCTQNASWCVK